MTEEQWRACADAQAMLEFVRGKASERKLRLFAVACVRRVWHLLADAAGRRVAEQAETYADGGGRRPAVAVGGTGPDPRETAAKAARFTAARVPLAAACGAASEAADAVAEEFIAEAQSEADEVLLAAAEAGRREEGWQAHLARCVFGNPFRPVAFDPAFRQWNSGTPVKLAQEMYESRDFSKAPLLADMLEDAGVSDAQLLGHLRSPGPHARGCFAIDLILEKT
jgi:hypothetical protein